MNEPTRNDFTVKIYPILAASLRKFIEEYEPHINFMTEVFDNKKFHNESLNQLGKYKKLYRDLFEEFENNDVYINLIIDDYLDPDTYCLRLIHETTIAYMEVVTDPSFLYDLDHIKFFSNCKEEYNDIADPFSFETKPVYKDGVLDTRFTQMTRKYFDGLTDWEKELYDSTIKHYNEYEKQRNQIGLLCLKRVLKSSVDEKHHENIDTLCDEITSLWV